MEREWNNENVFVHQARKQKITSTATTTAKFPRSFHHLQMNQIQLTTLWFVIAFYGCKQKKIIDVCFFSTQHNIQHLSVNKRCMTITAAQYVIRIGLILWYIYLFTLWFLIGVWNIRLHTTLYKRSVGFYWEMKMFIISNKIADFRYAFGFDWVFFFVQLKMKSHDQLLLIIWQISIVFFFFFSFFDWNLHFLCFFFFSFTTNTRFKND